MQVSKIILKNLLKNQEYFKRVLPFIEEDYFVENSDKVLFKHIKEYAAKYNNAPTIEALYVEMAYDSSINETTSKEIDDKAEFLKSELEKSDINWLLTTTENFCKERAMHNAIYESISILDGKSKTHTSGAIPDIVTKALSVSFNKSVGHDYIEDAAKRFEYYHKPEEKVKLGLEDFNKVTKGGFGNKTLNLFLSATHGGKSAMMCFLASRNLMDGKNVLYISLEMSEEEISKRIDANLMNITFDELMQLPHKMFFDKISKIQTKTTGKLIAKEYPTSAAHVGHIRSLLNELKLKKNFTPDIIYIDYLNIMISYRIKPGTSANSYQYNKAISEELRGLAVEFDVPIVSASQFNRGAASSSDPNMEDISESFGVNFTADFIAALVSSDELKEQKLMLVKQLKSRYDDFNKRPKFFIGFDRDKMQFFDVDENQFSNNKPKEVKEEKAAAPSAFNFSKSEKKTLEGFI